ncbi:hypothetical protein [Bradyrhizobium sp. AZCC 2289]|uniref:hypothetical protein n=1 Tax=Bradyrhizobium sp. AZCC 2289 TaxID=3117026 RepID=UPI003063CC22
MTKIERVEILQVDLVPKAVRTDSWVEWIPQLDDITTSRLAIEDGRARPPSVPGLGIAWDWPAITRLQIFTPVVLSA